MYTVVVVKQIEYAALDALVLIEIAKKLRLDGEKSKTIEIHLNYLTKSDQTKSNRKSKNSLKKEASPATENASSHVQPAPAYNLIPPPEDGHSHAFLCDNTLKRLCRWYVGWLAGWLAVL